MKSVNRFSQPVQHTKAVWNSQSTKQSINRLNHRTATQAEGLVYESNQRWRAGSLGRALAFASNNEWLHEQAKCESEIQTKLSERLVGSAHVFIIKTRLCCQTRVVAPTLMRHVVYLRLYQYWNNVDTWPGPITVTSRTDKICRLCCWKIVGVPFFRIEKKLSQRKWLAF